MTPPHATHLPFADLDYVMISLHMLRHAYQWQAYRKKRRNRTEKVLLDDDPEHGGDRETAHTLLRHVRDDLDLDASVHNELDEAIEQAKARQERIDIPWINRWIVTRLRQHRDRRPAEREHPLVNNLLLLGEMLNLTQVEKNLLALLITIHTDEGCRQSAQKIDQEVIDCFKAWYGPYAYLLEQPEEVVSKAFDQDGTLMETGLIEPEVEHFSDMEDLVQVSSALRRLAREVYTSPEQIMRLWLRPLRSGTLRASNYPHLQKALMQLKGYLQGAKQHRLEGVNVFLYGPPGTGKTELARILAEEGGFSAYEVDETAGNDDVARNMSRSRTPRLAMYRLAQSLLKNQPNALIVFDEAEDLFGQGGNLLDWLFGQSPSQRRTDKNRINTLLETSPVPTIWISNHIQQIDPAHMRRHDFLLEVPIPPRSVRRGIIQDHWRAFEVSDALLDALADVHDTPPSIYAQAAKVASHVDCTESEREQLLLDQINRWRRSQSLPAIRVAKHTDTFAYNVNLINTEPSAGFLVRMLANAASARLCFYGPPGTGKTAFARHLAKTLDRPLMIQRYSDLASPYVGVMEKNLAEAFKRAEWEGAILFLDEGDSLLQDRTRAQRNWEISQTNELLSQMEAFEGLFILATNLVEHLDRAAMRRFDFQVRFKALTPEQKWAFFTQLVPDADDCYREHLNELPLAHGHFATVWRQLKLADITADETFCLSLLRERVHLTREANE
ncbi:MAG: AAA family ATPase [Nitrospirae bacterium]|nr:MAG: AAA family ATPase [Nitrospirota bacterium]